MAFKQLDSVWSDINPVFQLYELIPLKPTEFPPESMFFICVHFPSSTHHFFLYFLVPALLSTNIPTEDVEANIEPKMEYTSSRQDIEAVVEHNQQIKRILASYSEKAAPLMRNKRQKIDNRAKIFNPDFVKEQLSSFR